MNNIYITGFMGCGKTTIGKKMSLILGKQYIDTDIKISNECDNMSITQIFSTFSEAYFRTLETNALNEIKLTNNKIIALGGGIFDNPTNYTIIKDSGVIVYLYVPFHKCYNRILNDPLRPLVSKYTKEELQELYNKRENIYRQNCSYIYDANKSILLCARELAQLIRM